jgi:hypothetical protein
LEKKSEPARTNAWAEPKPGNSARETAIEIPVTSVQEDAPHRHAAAAEGTLTTLPHACPGALPALPLCGLKAD